MKPYINLQGKGRYAYFWGDKVKKVIKRVFKKSFRQQNKKINYE
jgi:hypothetical protein